MPLLYRWIGLCIGALLSHLYCLFFCNASSLLSLALACDAPSHSIGNHSKTAVQLTSVSMTETNEHSMALLSLHDCIWRWLSTTAANIVTRESLKMVGRTNAECPGSAQPKKRHVMPACLHFHSCTDGGIVRTCDSATCSSFGVHPVIDPPF